MKKCKEELTKCLTQCNDIENNIDFSNLYKYLNILCGEFFNPAKLLSYRRPVMCVTGSRSIGKSTGIALLCLLNYIFNGKKFMYIRRRPKTVQKTAKTFFNNAVEIINSNDKVDITIVGFKYYNGRYYIATKLTEEGEPEWEECGKSQALSDEEDDKSAIYSEYNILIYDEFITKDKNRYLSTNANIEAEWDACVSLYQTVDRGVNKPFRNETVFFLLGNKSTVFNPIFITLGIINYLNADAKYTAPKGEIWLWNDIDGVEATSKYADSFAYKMSTERTKKYAYENDGGDNNDFVEKPKNAKYIATFIL